MMQAQPRQRNLYPLIKRFSDVVSGALLLLLASPALLLISSVVLLTDGRPVFFRQLRPGFQGEPFLLLKFRSMKIEQASGLTDESDRVTRLGKILRRTSLDELPSLWNIVRGDMSFVGPRPLLMEYLALYSPQHKTRHEVRPGLTGLAQASGRNRVLWNTRLDLDAAYVQQQSFLLDLSILVRTVGLVATSRGVTREDGTTMPPLQEGYYLREMD